MFQSFYSQRPKPKAKVSGFFLLSILSLWGCGGSSGDTPALEESMVPETTNIEPYISIQHGDPEQMPTVLLYSDGGPLSYADDDTFGFISQIDDENGEKIDFTNIAFVYVKQSQMIQTQNYTQTRAYNLIEQDAQQSADILYQVAKYYKSQGKTVYVQGASHGGFVVLAMLAKYGPQAADAFLVQSSRLNTPEALIDAFKSNQRAGFVYDNSAFQEGELIIHTDYWLESCQPRLDIALDSCASNSERSIVELQQNMDKLNAAIATPRYVSILGQYDDLSNLGFTFANNDEQLGGLSAEESTFLTQKGAILFEVEGGGHVGGALTKQVAAMREVFLMPSQ